MHLTLLVPELIWPEPADQFTLGKLSVPALEWLLAHGALTRHPRRPFEYALADCFGLTEAPLGALRLLGEGDEQARAGHWMCADPVHLRFHHERIVLADAGAFELDADEARRFTESLNAEFADIGRFHVADARRWYLQLNATESHALRGADGAVAPLSAIAGRRVDSELPKGDATLSRWLNEVQMFLHGHPVNDARQAAGKPAVNSLWLWGGGALGETGPTAFSEVWSDNPLAAGLALAGKLPLHDRPATFAALLPQAGERPLVVLDQLLPRVLYDDGDGWKRACEQLDTEWFAPLRQALGGKIERIELIAPTIYGELRYTVTGGERWKFWKGSRPLSAVAAALADELAAPATESTR